MRGNPEGENPSPPLKIKREGKMFKVILAALIMVAMLNPILGNAKSLSSSRPSRSYARPSITHAVVAGAVAGSLASRPVQANSVVTPLLPGAEGFVKCSYNYSTPELCSTSAGCSKGESLPYKDYLQREKPGTSMAGFSLDERNQKVIIYYKN